MAHEVAQYLSIDAVKSPTVTVDGNICYLADTTGTPQAWRLREARGYPERLTPHQERVSFVDASPTRLEVSFGMDRDGNERDQLYRYELTEGRIHQLTADPSVKHVWGGWSPSGDRIAYSANRDATARFDVYVQERSAPAGAPDPVFEGEEGLLSVAAWGPDGKRLALKKPRGKLEVDLFVLDVAGGTTRHLSADSSAYFVDVHFGTDAHTLYAVTNHDAETAYVAMIDVATGEIRPLTGTGEWSVDALAMDRRTGRLVYATNVDGYSTLTAGYLDGDEFVEHAAPGIDGVVHDLVTSPMGIRYVFVESASARPRQVRAAEFGTDIIKDWTDVGTCGIPRERFHSPEIVRYESFDGLEIPAYWSVPSEAEPTDPVPAIVDLHGGPEAQRRPWFAPPKQFHLGRGYAVFEPNVRGSTGYGRAYTHLDDGENRLAAVQDVAAGVEWLSNRDVVDPDRIIAYGRSYGGFLVLSAITEFPDLWAAAVEFVGIANFVTFLENTGAWRRRHREAEYGSLADDREFLQSISPIHKVGEIQCPLFIQHGVNDPRVPVEEAKRIASALEDRGIPFETCLLEDEGHHTTKRENLIEEFERIADFLDDHVGTTSSE